jgi:hypothetical protein
MASKVRMVTTGAKIKTKFGWVLTPSEEKAYTTIKRLIEHEEEFAGSHSMADAFRSYFKKEYISE